MLRNLFAKARALFTRKQAEQTYRYAGPPRPVVTRSQRRADMLLRLAAARGDNPGHYPYLSCRAGKPKGKRDRSQKQRSNRRKAAARTHAR